MKLLVLRVSDINSSQFVIVGIMFNIYANIFNQVT